MEKYLKVIVLIISFILWLGYIFFSICQEINRKNTLKISYVKYLKRNIWHILRMDKLILIVVFYLYSRFNKATVDIYLFCIIMLYFFVNLLYEDINIKKINLKKEWPYFIFILTISLLFISIYYISKKIVLTFMLLFSYLYFFPFIFAIFDYLFNKKR